VWVFKGWWAVVSEIVVCVLIVVLAGAAGSSSSDTAVAIFATLAVLLSIKAIVMIGGFFLVKPNQSKVLVQFGRYVGTVRDEGFWWTWPWRLPRRTISLRIRTFDSDTLKVNDAVGNPVEIASVINWQVTDTARAAFDVEDYESFVYIQTEAAVRHVASEYPYDNWDDESQLSLRANADEVTSTLQAELQERLRVAGVDVLDTRLRRLAYAPEIAGEMLRRQQANAVVAARQRIVEGAVTMVDHALQMLSEQQIVELDEERKAAMVSNLLVVLCSDRGAQPVVNSSSLYQ
jgi:regulator of protease activity HflC (stomatin/prohibitin superfamily)